MKEINIIAHEELELDPNVNKEGQKEKSQDYQLGDNPVFSDASNALYEARRESESTRLEESVENIFNNSVEKEETVGSEAMFAHDVTYNNIVPLPKAKQNINFTYLLIPLIVIGAYVATIQFRKMRKKK